MSIPFDQVERLEYVDIGGLVLATPAWECVDSSSLYDAPPVRGDDVVVPYHEGAVSFRRIVGPRRVVLPMVVYGDVDREGLAYSDGRAGLRANLDALKREVLRPVQSGDGTKLLRHVFSDGEVRQAPCQVIPPVQTGPLSPNSVRCTIDVVIPGGVLRSVTPQDVSKTIFPLSDDLVVPNMGSGDQFESVVHLAGTATRVRIVQRSWDPAGGTWLEYVGSVAAGVTLDTAAWTARAGLANVIGNVEHAGHERWLPLVPGQNVLEVTPTGGSVTVSVAHYPAWL